ncbi:phosphotransferase [Enemella evansiae]|nr:phosphotransferase [Enemella evansiae]
MAGEGDPATAAAPVPGVRLSVLDLAQLSTPGYPPFIRSTHNGCVISEEQPGRDLNPPPATERGRVIVITGAMAAGKSTVAALLAEQLHPRSVHIRGDAFRRMVINGRAEMTPDPDPEALRQLHLRYSLAAATADRYADHGFDAIVQDVIIGAELSQFIDLIDSPSRYLVVLSPSLSALEWRQEQRAKAGSVYFSPGAMDTALRQETARIGYWLDSSSQTPEETVGDILGNLDQARV